MSTQYMVPQHSTSTHAAPLFLYGAADVKEAQPAKSRRALPTEKALVVLSILFSVCGCAAGGMLAYDLSLMAYPATPHWSTILLGTLIGLLAGLFLVLLSTLFVCISSSTAKAQQCAEEAARQASRVGAFQRRGSQPPC